jgi:hypothetical protein
VDKIFIVKNNPLISASWLIWKTVNRAYQAFLISHIMTFFYVHKFIGFIAGAPKVAICQLFFRPPSDPAAALYRKSSRPGAGNPPRWMARRSLYAPVIRGSAASL